MRAVIECAGAPRDLGRDQGAACRALLGRDYGRAPAWERLRWRSGLSASGAARTTRDLGRHFPRHAEALEGLARGAGVPRRWLDERLARTLTRPAVLGPGRGLAAAAPATAGSLLALALPAGWLLRRSRPEGGIPCLEIALPWFAGALAAVSEAGVAAAVIPGAGASPAPGCAAPAALLVQDALHRTDSLSGALDWCLRRPAGGRATLLFAEASGEVAALRIDAASRRVHRAAEALLVEAGSTARSGEIAKAFRETGHPADALDCEAAVLDPAARSLAHRRPGDVGPLERWLLGG